MFALSALAFTAALRGRATRPLLTMVVSALFSALMAACAGGPATDTGDSSTVPVQEIPPETGRETLYSQRLQHAASLYQQDYLYAAASILSDLSDSKLTRSERLVLLDLRSGIDMRLGRNAEALDRLRNTLPLLQGGNGETVRVLGERLVSLTAAVEGTLAAARTADALLLSTEDAARETALVERIWSLLQTTPEAELEAARESARGHWLGWIDLALLAADTLESPAAQQAQVALWQERHAQHRASLHLPTERAVLSASVNPGERLPGRVALLLALTAGGTEQADAQSILAGYMAAAFEARRRGWPGQELMVMDTHAHPDLRSAYDTARRAGAELVIAQAPHGSAPDWQPATTPLVLLGTAPQPHTVAPASASPLDIRTGDPLDNLLDYAASEGKRRALLLRPNSAWGDRISDRLGAAWHDRGADLQAVAVYTGQDDYSTALKAALNIDASEKRHQRLRQLLGESTEFYPRRRQDLDSVFLLASTAQEARSLKPLLAFHYAGDLPVYANSNIFSGRRDPQRDRDLNGAVLVLSPWVLNPTGQLQSDVAPPGEDGKALDDLQALGADARLLQWRLVDLQQPGVVLRGLGGTLYRDSEGNLHRQRQVAVFRNGEPLPR
ncbi:MAG: penicillin-binding protein activator [Halieaceae bacterium]|jgi:outer membrane PBP1 activator LpoA protein|nr:penicillin-binding protein activator [Halieaceae bacterium]